MRIVLAGGHGKIALILTRLLATRGDEVLSLVRDPDHVADVRAVGAEPLLLDLERTAPAELAAAVTGYDAAVFAAGAGPGSSAERKYTVDRDGSVLLAGACETAGVRRFVQISTAGAGAPPAQGSDPVWAAYLDAKTQAEQDLKSRNLEWTVLRPGTLTDVTAVEHVTLSAQPIPPGTVSREDVAAVIAELLIAPGVGDLTLELTEGPTPIPQAVAQLRLDHLAD